mmetsp:Transcript_4062/g.14346  ORF Transcript_4062/g.14346 Transcript_4062/m.14346 type:complete len:92 (-) Transcript_4062:133-408(-)
MALARSPSAATVVEEVQAVEADRYLDGLDQEVDENGESLPKDWSAEKARKNIKYGVLVAVGAGIGVMLLLVALFAVQLVQDGICGRTLRAD